MKEGDGVPVVSAEAKGHDTQPPDRYSEATLIKKLEDLGIGRPSTYASVMKTIDRRGYVWKKGKSLVPAFKAFAVVNLLQEYFTELVDYQFTALMEEQLDEIASGEMELVPWLNKFYFGNPEAESRLSKLGLQFMTQEKHEFDYAAINSVIIGTAPDGLPISVRSGRYGPYLVHGEDRASIPEATEPDSLTVERALELLAAPSNDRELGIDPETNLPVFIKAGRFGPYIQLGEMTDPKNKPRTASLFSTMSPETITFEEAQGLLSLPRTIGLHPEDQAPITAQNGRYGPYITWNKEARTLETEEQIFTVDLDGALALLAQPRPKGRRAAAGPLKELGEDPVTKRNVVVRNGKFGMYVTDGEVNATMRIGDTVELITLERACELLAERRNIDPSTIRPRKTVAKKSTKKAAKKPAKKTAEKTTKRVVAKGSAAEKRAAVAEGAKANAAITALATNEAL
jgi:DNA topoisomerase-1